MKISEKQLRSIINETIAESLPPPAYTKKKSKFFDNDERLKHLRTLKEAGDFQAFQKQSWEWIKTGKFEKSDYVLMLKLLWGPTV